jgi:uncharacterized RDD family membrane protein YckC
MTEPAMTGGRPEADDQERIWDVPGEGLMEGAPSGAPLPGPSEATAAPAPPAPAITRPGRPGALWARSLTSTTQLPGPAGLTFADVPDRIIAIILDVIVLSGVGLFLALVIGGAFGGLVSGAQSAGGSLDDTGGQLNIGAFLVVGVAELAISFAYFAWSWVVLRATPGMMMLGLQVGDQGDGRSISWDQALLRWLVLGIAATLTAFAVFVPSILGLLVAIVGLAWLLVLLATTAQSPTKQGLHDRIARTVLVKAARRPAGSADEFSTSRQRRTRDGGQDPNP